MPTGFSFHPEIDRFDPANVARFFTSTWPDEAISQAIAANLAESIQQAHAAGEGSWSVTLHRDFIRLNVGQVETFTAYEEGCRFLICLPLARISHHALAVGGGRTELLGRLPDMPGWGVKFWGSGGRFDSLEPQK